MDTFIMIIGIIQVISTAIFFALVMNIFEDEDEDKDEILSYKIKDDEIIFIMKSGTVYIQCLKTGKQRKV